MSSSPNQILFNTLCLCLLCRRFPTHSKHSSPSQTAALWLLSSYSRDDLWFDDVDPDVIEETMGAEAAEIMRRKQGVRSKSKEQETSLVKESAFSGWVTAPLENIPVRKTESWCCIWCGSLVGINAKTNHQKQINEKLWRRFTKLILYTCCYSLLWFHMWICLLYDIIIVGNSSGIIL